MTQQTERLDRNEQSDSLAAFMRAIKFRAPLRSKARFTACLSSRVRPGRGSDSSAEAPPDISTRTRSSAVRPETVVPATVPAPEVLYTSREGILARQTDEGWMAMPHRTVVRAGDRVASLEPFTALLEVSSLNLLIELQGGTVIEFLGATSDEQISLQLLAGRISLHRRSAEVDTQPVVAGLHLLDEPCRLTLHSAVALCGVELTAAEPYAYEKELGEDRYIGNLFVVDGRVSFKGELAGDVSLTAPSWFPLTPVDRRAVAESNDLSPLLIVPEWLDPSGSRVSSTQRRYAARFEKEVDEEQPLHNSIPSIVKSKIPGISEFAVKAMAATGMYNQLVQVMAEAEFLEGLADVEDPEAKRKVIGNTFIDVFDREAKKIPNARWLAQGTIYPDVIESAASKHGKAHVIKSHHNVGGLPEQMDLKLVEPLRELFKDEVRKIGIHLGLPESLVYRHPFPGPGLGVRILGAVNKTYADVLREADAIFIGELREADLYDQVSQAFAVYLPVKSVGVVGDARRYEHVIALRAVETIDFMTARAARLPHEFIERVSNRIVNEIAGVSRVVYDLSSKPPATIEWE